MPIDPPSAPRCPARPAQEKQAAHCDAPHTLDPGASHCTAKMMSGWRKTDNPQWHASPKRVLPRAPPRNACRRRKAHAHSARASARQPETAASSVAARTGHEFRGVDWHQSRWFAVALLIVILSCADAFFTLRLLADGAYEANPFMAALLNGPPHGFAFAKVGLTSIGVILLTMVARTRAFRLIPVGRPCSTPCSSDI